MLSKGVDELSDSLMRGHLSPVEAMVLGAIIEARCYRRELAQQVRFPVQEIEQALLYLQEHHLIVQWGGARGREHQFFLATGSGVERHSEFATSLAMRFRGGGLRALA